MPKQAITKSEPHTKKEEDETQGESQGESQDESQDESDNEQLSEEQSSDEEETKTTEERKKKLSPEELFNEISTHFSSLDTTYQEFIKKEQTFEKEQKEFNSFQKKTMRDITGLMKRFEKSFKNTISKKKPRKTENAGKGGFNKPSSVPKVLREYIGIEDEQMTRPQVTKLLNQKFSEAGLMSTKKDDNGKETKIIVLDKMTAKKLNRKNGDEIRNRDIQTFIAKFYKEEKDKLTINA
jgi:hypothetical protein